MKSKHPTVQHNWPTRKRTPQHQKYYGQLKYRTHWTDQK